jgi:hypothetical protein
MGEVREVCEVCQRDGVQSKGFGHLALDVMIRNMQRENDCNVNTIKPEIGYCAEPMVSGH